MKDNWVDFDFKDYFRTSSWTGNKDAYEVGITAKINNSWTYNVTPELVKSFREAEARMEKEAKEKELREKQVKNKRLRRMIKKVILNDPCTIIMWNDGTKTVTKCHKLDSYDPEKGILACMAKKLYENTNLFNEVIQEYVDFDTCNAESENECFKSELEQAKRTIDKFQITLTGAIDGTICDLEKELAYYKQLSEKLANDIELRDDCLNIKIARIKGLEDELYWRDCQIDDLHEELYEAKTNRSE